MIIDRSKQQKNLLEMLQEKNEYISAPCNGNGICGKCIVRYKSGATEPTKAGQRSFYRKNNWRMDTVLPVNHHPVGAYEVELPESEETIEVLSAVGEAAENGYRRTYRSLYPNASRSENKRRHTGQRNSRRNGRENRKCNLWNLYRHRHHDFGSTCLVNLKTEADCQTAVSVNHQRTYGCRCDFKDRCL